MLDDSPRVTFRVNDIVYAQMHALAARHEQSLSQLCRDAVALLLADTTAYNDLLSRRVLAHARPPTPAQAEASQHLIIQAMATDWTALFLDAVSSPESCTHDARGLQI
jgi:hypothetical protein